MPRIGMSIAGATILTVSGVGTVLTAIYLPIIVPVFAFTGTIGIAMLGRTQLKRLVTCCCGQGPPPEVAPIPPPAPVPTVLPPAPELTPARHLECQAPGLTPESGNRAMLHAYQNHREGSLHRHESWEEDGQRVEHNETYRVTNRV